MEFSVWEASSQFQNPRCAPILMLPVLCASAGVAKVNAVNAASLISLFLILFILCLSQIVYLTNIIFFPLPELELSEVRSNFATPFCRQLVSGGYELFGLL